MNLTDTAAGTFLESHPKYIGVLFAAFTLLADAGVHTVAAGGGSIQGP